MICNKCQLSKEDIEFYKDSGKKSGYRQPCKKCVPSRKDYHTKWRINNPDKMKKIQNKRNKVRRENPDQQRDYALKRNYNISLEQYNNLLKEQSNKCKICKRTPEITGKTFAVDHDHKCCSERSRSCGLCIRGLLCVTCNQALGMFLDSEEILDNAIDYLKNSRLNARSMLGQEGAQMFAHFG